MRTGIVMSPKVMAPFQIDFMSSASGGLQRFSHSR
jgi:hypothetical protein